MNKEYKIKLDLNKKLYNKKMMFNQFDENVNDFYIEITKNNEVVKNLDKSIVTLVAIKPNGEVDAQFIEVKEGQIYADLKPSMCDLIGNYQAKAMIALEGEIVTTDTINYSVNEDKIISRLNDDVTSDERFTLFTDALARLSTIETSEEQRMINEAERILAEENRKIEEAKRVEAELVRQHEEADRAKYDATRESNENIRKQNESIRLANETNRIDEEAKRVEEENKRKLAEEERNANYNFMTEDEERRRSEANAHKEAENLRVQAETNRVNEEAKRRTTEQARVSAENTRVSNENTREANEITRKSNETKRIEAETQRQNRYNSFIADAETNANNFENYTNNAKVKEEERKSNELERKSQETQRVSNENERLANEETRKANEVVREENETSRQDVFENKVSEVDEKIIEINTTKDNFVSSINTKVDNKISELDNAKSDMTNTVSNKVNEVETRFNALTSKQQQDAEVIDARDGETSLKARLDRDIEKAKQVYVNVEGSNVSTDSSSGYAKNVEILGNTIQDASNLADIRSVGDKVEGQELYEIPVLSVGKNLNSSSIKRGNINANTGIEESGAKTMLCTENFIRAKSETRYVISSNISIGSILLMSYDEDKKYLGYCNVSNGYLETKIGTKYVKFRFAKSPSAEFTDLEVSNIKVQFEEGTQATPYEPYQEDKLTILSPVQLEKVGDVADRIIEKDGVWGVEKNIGSMLMNGTQSSSLAKTNSSTAIFRVSCENLKIATNSTKLICDKFKPGFVWSSDVEGVYCDRSASTLGSVILGIMQDRLTSVTVVGLNEWLSNNNVLVKYQLETPQFIPLPHDQQIKLRTFANKTNISFLTEIEGTIKAQVPKSLGATVNTHTEQINNLNKELDRVKKLEESTVSTVETESDFTTVEATSNGYFEDVKLEGKTLVNLYNPISISPSPIGWNSMRIDATRLEREKEYTFVINNLPNGFRYVITTIADVYLFQYTTSTCIKFKMIDAKENYLVLHLNEPNMSPLTLEQMKNLQIVILEDDHTQNPPSYFEGIKSVGDGADEIVVSSVNSDNTKSDKKRLLYYNNETQSWEKPILREWDSIEKHADGKYYYHKRSGEVVLNGSENWALASGTELDNTLCFAYPKSECATTFNKNIIFDKFTVDTASYVTSTDIECGTIFATSRISIRILKSKLSTQDVAGFKKWLQANNVTVVYQLAQEKLYECTNIDLITYANETNYIVECGAIVPKSTLKVHNNISNVVSLLQKKVSLLESNIKASQEVQDMMILETDMRMLDIELALMEFVPMKLNLGGSNMVRSATYFNFVKNHIINETYEKEYLENVMNKYLATGRINQDEYNELYKMLYPPVYDIELPIEY